MVSCIPILALVTGLVYHLVKKKSTYLQPRRIQRNNGNPVDSIAAEIDLSEITSNRGNPSDPSPDPLQDGPGVGRKRRTRHPTAKAKAKEAPKPTQPPKPRHRRNAKHENEPLALKQKPHRCKSWETSHRQNVTARTRNFLALNPNKELYVMHIT